MVARVSGDTGVDKVKDIDAVRFLPFIVEYVSPPFTDYTAGSTKTFTHTLNARPKGMELWMRCTSAINGFVVGEEVLLNNVTVDTNTATSATRGFQLSSIGTTDLRLVFGAQQGCILVNSPGAGVNPLAANFEAFVRAWA